MVLRLEGFFEEALPNIFIAQRLSRVSDGYLRVVSKGRLVLGDQPARCRLTYHLTPSVAYPKILPVWTTSESHSRAARGAQAPESEAPRIAATNQMLRQMCCAEKNKSRMYASSSTVCLTVSKRSEGRQECMQLGC